MSFKKRFKITKDDHLSLCGIDLVDLCNKYGTPLFVFDEAQIRENYQRFCSAFQKHYPKTIVCYSIKTNYNLTICKTMQEESAYAAIGSGLDLYVAKKAGFPPERIIFDGLYKPEPLLREAIESRISMINVESFSELELIDKIAGELGRKQSIGIRISNFPHKILNPENLYCNPHSRFGFSLKDTFVAFKKALKLKNVEVKGIMIHPYWGIHWFLPLVRRIQKEYGIDIPFLNFGGGFTKLGTRKIGIPDLIKDYLRQKFGLKSKLDSISKERIREIEESARLIIEEVQQTLGNRESTLVFEPGRYIIHDAGFLLLRVGVVKRASGFKWIVVDGGVNLNTDWLERREIKLVNRMSAPLAEAVNVVGPLLFARDFVTIKKALPEIQIGDILVVSHSGAYTLSNSTQFLNPRPPAVLVRPDGKITEIRAKETYDDVLRMDKLD